MWRMSLCGFALLFLSANSVLYGVSFEKTHSELQQRKNELLKTLPLEDRQLWNRAEKDYAEGLLVYEKGDRSPVLFKKMHLAFLVQERFLAESIPGLLVEPALVLASIGEANGAFEVVHDLLVQASERASKGLNGPHPFTGLVLQRMGRWNLDRVYRTGKELSQAQKLLSDALKIIQETVGDSSLPYASCLADYAVVRAEQNLKPEADSLLAKALEAAAVAVGKKHPDYADILIKGAEIEWSKGNKIEATTLVMKAHEIYLASVPHSHVRWASMMYRELNYLVEEENNMAFPYLTILMQSSHVTPYMRESFRELAGRYHYQTRDYDRAEASFLRSITFFEKIPGKKSGQYLRATHWLCDTYIAKGDFERAKPLCHQTEEALRTRLGITHPTYSLILTSLARLYTTTEPTRAKDYFDQALEIQEQIPNDSPLIYYRGLTLRYQARLLMAAGDTLTAGLRLLQASDIFLTRNGSGFAVHQTTSALFDNALLEHHLGHTALAKRNALLALSGEAQAFRTVGIAYDTEKSLKESIQWMRQSFDLFLTLCADTNDDSEIHQLYGNVLYWKGALLSRHETLREKAKTSPELRNSYHMLLRLNKAISDFTFIGANDPESTKVRDEQWQALIGIKEVYDLMAGKMAFENQGEFAPEHIVNSVSRKLAKSDALIDVVQYSHISGDVDGKRDYDRRYLAFIVRPSGIRLIPLGSAEFIDSRVRLWRHSFADQIGQEGFVVSEEAGNAAGQQLREVIWKPLQEALKGASTLIYSPDGELALLPLVALPGEGAKRYLLEELAVQDRQLIHLPVPSLLSNKETSTHSPAAGNLLVMGEIAYDKRPVSSGRIPSDILRKDATLETFMFQKVLEWKGLAERPGSQTFIPLDTKEETENVASRFKDTFALGNVTRLQGANASAEGFRDLASQHRWIHLSTHGFFDPGILISEKIASHTAEPEYAIDKVIARRFEPGLYSGIVFAGANLERYQIYDNGLLTTEEISFLNLEGVELVVLSACDTASGTVEPGEGVLGVQRGFQAAGAKNSVAALWRVESLPTTVLMNKFYENLWSNKLPVARALQAAQLALVEMKMPPQFWAAFIASGEWR